MKKEDFILRISAFIAIILFAVFITIKLNSVETERDRFNKVCTEASPLQVCNCIYDSVKYEGYELNEYLIAWCLHEAGLLVE